MNLVRRALEIVFARVASRCKAERSKVVNQSLQSELKSSFDFWWVVRRLAFREAVTYQGLRQFFCRLAAKPKASRCEDQNGFVGLAVFLEARFTNLG